MTTQDHDRNISAEEYASVHEPETHPTSQDSKGKEPAGIAPDFKLPSHENEDYAEFMKTPSNSQLRTSTSLANRLDMSFTGPLGMAGIYGISTNEENDNALLSMGLSARPLPPKPALNDFILRIGRLCPRMAGTLLTRFAEEQQSRYHLLKEADTRHSRVVADNQCPSESFCFKQGGRARHFLSADDSSIAQFPPGSSVQYVLK
ncbi:uncharacterized protein N7503_010355 [Penicillium pulvis]|uniref:uncharacterized protein n=1 Tax=Penicillium pulvis TaxID=1562058 RepID=UPI0025472A7C|nr:uncharacterized protein N7503_010355 [Penicillium pulvis]KAJ5785143.1 hypothetical protein N7503_010355 [Penicillium pulvis]